MYAAKFTVFYIIAALAAMVSASPVPVPAPEARLSNIDIVAREPVPAENLDARTCESHEGFAACF